MRLFLYRTPYVDPLKPDSVRLLFEAKADDEQNQTGSDFYLYVWITRSGSLESFQGVCGDSVALTHSQHTGLSWGKVSRSIMNRGITEMESVQERKACIDTVDAMKSEEFPLLLETIKKIVAGESGIDNNLPAKELELFRKMCRSLKHS
jgi:hypothetical protein